MVLEVLPKSLADYPVDYDDAPGEKSDSPEVLPAERFYLAEAKRLRYFAEDASRGYAYAQGQELVNILGKRSASIATAAATERINRWGAVDTGDEKQASWVLSDCFTSARRFLDTDPRVKQHTDHDPGQITELPLDSPLTAPVLDELKAALLVEDSIDIGKPGRHQTGLLDIYINFVDGRNKEGRPVKRVILDRALSTDQHEEYLAKFTGIYPNQTAPAPPRPAAPSYTPRHGYTSVSSTALDRISHAPTNPTNPSPRPQLRARNMPQRHGNRLTNADTQNIPGVANSAAPAERAAADGSLVDKIDRVRRWAGDSAELSALRKRVVGLEARPSDPAGYGADPVLKRTVRDNLEHAVVAAAAMFASPPDGMRLSRSVRILSIPSTRGFDPTTRSDAATEATKSEIEKFFGVSDTDLVKERRYYNQGKDGVVFSRPTRAFPGFELSYHYIRTRNGGHSKFEIMLERDPKQQR